MQSPKATALIERAPDGGNPGFISTVVMVETAWVLERSYALADHEIAAVIERILQIESLFVENRIRSLHCLDGAQGRPRLICRCPHRRPENAQAGCSRTLTFDRKALRLPGFELL